MHQLYYVATFAGMIDSFSITGNETFIITFRSDDFFKIKCSVFYPKEHGPNTKRDNSYASKGCGRLKNCRYLLKILPTPPARSRRLPFPSYQRYNHPSLDQ